MTALPLSTASRPGAVRSLSLPCVESDDLETVRLLREHPLPRGIRRELAGAAHEVFEQLISPAARPAVELADADGALRLGSEALEVAGPGFDLVRSRTGARIVLTGSASIRRNGWPVREGRPVAVRDGDTIAVGGRSYVARFDPAMPRSFVEIGPARRAQTPSRSGRSFAFVVEPAGERFVLHCDGPSERAILDLALGGDGSRPFDPTALGEVDRAVVDWLVHRFAHDAARSLFGHSASVRPVDDDGIQPPLWFSVAARVGSHHGVWWLGATQSGIRMVSHLLQAETRSARTANPALWRIEAWVVVRMPLGRVSVRDVAAVEPGDLFVARSGARLCSSAIEGDGVLTVSGADGSEVPVKIASDGGVLRARVLGLRLERRSDEMNDGTTIGTEVREGGSPFETVLDGIGVMVSVEIARRRMTLGELLSVSVGDVVELGAPVQNAVSLLIDGSPFARGELVDVDSALGIRVVALGRKR